MKIVLCAIILLVFADAAFSEKWSAPEGSVVHRSAQSTLGRKDVIHNIKNLQKRHERENMKVINLVQLATKTSKEKMNKTKSPRKYLFHFSGRSTIDDIKRFLNVDFKPRHERLTKLSTAHLRRRPPKPPRPPPKTTTTKRTTTAKTKPTSKQDIKVSAEFHIHHNTSNIDRDKKPGSHNDNSQGATEKEPNDESSFENSGKESYLDSSSEHTGISDLHLLQGGKVPAQYATHDDNFYDDGTHISIETKGPAEYKYNNKPNNGAKVEKVVILEIPSDKDFESLSKYNQEQKSKELNKRLEGYWKKEYQSKHQSDYPIYDDFGLRMKKKVGQYGK